MFIGKSRSLGTFIVFERVRGHFVLFFEDAYSRHLRWDFASSVEEVMTHLHALVMRRQVLYLGASDTPAWVVVKANDCKSGQTLAQFPGKFNDKIFLKTLDSMGLLHSLSTRAGGTQLTVTWRPRSSPCVRTRAWLLCPGRRLVAVSCLRKRRGRRQRKIQRLGKATDKTKRKCESPKSSNALQTPRA